MKIAHLTSAHRPDDVRIFLKECRSLAEAGHDVTLVAQASGDSVQSSVKIVAVPAPKNRNERMLKTVANVFRVALHVNADVYHFHDPELVFVGMLLKARGKKVIFDMHEDLPKQILTKEWIPGPLRRLTSASARTLEFIFPYIFDHLIAATPAIGRKFPGDRTEIVQNFPFSEELEGPPEIPYSERPPNVAYVGGIGAVRGIRQMVQSLEWLDDFPELRLLLAGEFNPAPLRDEVGKLPGWKRVEYLHQQSRAQVKILLSHARAGLVLFQPAPNHMEAQPNKLFEYMSAGLPVIASNFPLWRELIESEGTGVLVDPTSPREIANAIRWILSNPEEAERMGKRGRNLIVSRTNWSIESQKLLRVYRKLSENTDIVP